MQGYELEKLVRELTVRIDVLEKKVSSLLPQPIPFQGAAPLQPPVGWGQPIHSTFTQQ